MYYSEHVLKTKNYINENLTTDLSLETLAEHVHFSPYHFHRLFLLYTGQSPMEYVRRLRLRSAAKELLSMKFDIIETAAKYQFESQDGFCRTFKRYYGITPGEYRKLNYKKRSDNLKEIREAKTIMYEMNMYQNLICSHDDKKEALTILDKLLELSEKAKRSGLLSLEQEIYVVQPDFFIKSIQMLIDGIEPESLREILMNYTLCGGYKGKELLIRILIIEGILAIQQGVHNLILREKLSSFFGEDFFDKIQKHFGLDSKSQLEKINEFIIKNQDKHFLSKEASLLEEPLGRMDNRSLQRLLREIDTVTLITAIKGSSGIIQAKVLNHISKKLAAILVNELDVADAPMISEIEAAQKQLLETMHFLRNQGDLII